MNSIIEDIENEQLATTPGDADNVSEGFITVEKLTEIRQIFEHYREDIPEEEMINFETETENPDYRVNLIKLKQQIEQMDKLIQAQSIACDDSTDIRLADFNILFAQFFKDRKDPNDKSPLFITNVQFSECISAFEMKIYIGEPITSEVNKGFRE